MVVEASTWETGVLVGSSARDGGGDMEQNVDKDADDDHWEDHDEAYQTCTERKSKEAAFIGKFL